MAPRQRGETRTAAVGDRSLCRAMGESKLIVVGILDIEGSYVRDDVISRRLILGR